MRRITAETYDACAVEWESYLREHFPDCRWNLARYADLEANDHVSQDTDGNDITVLFSEVVTRFTHLVHIPLPPCAESCGCPRRNAAPTDGERQPGALWLSQILTDDDAGDRGYAHPHPVPQHTTGR